MLLKVSSVYMDVYAGEANIINWSESKDYHQQHTVPLPYIVTTQGLTESDIRDYEDKCFNFLAARFVASKIEDVNPIGVLLLELVLACNGAYLRDEFLCRLGGLCDHHGVHIIVDEILTAGRCDSKKMLLTLTINQTKSFY